MVEPVKTKDEERRRFWRPATRSNRFLGNPQFRMNNQKPRTMHKEPLPSARPMPQDVVLVVRNVSKRFCRDLKRSMWYGMQDLAKNLLGWWPAAAPRSSFDPSEEPRTNGQPPITNNQCASLPPLRRDEFWALQDVSFDLRRGEILGIIGRNGSGKTTLLRMLSGIFPPDKGEISFRGRVTSLIALGAGFHPHMTGRENVFLNGTILGMTSREIRAKFDEIVEFSEIGDFIDAPVAAYSSGMKVRLGFAVAVHLDPSLLFIDEVLAVGDQAFKRKAEKHIRELLFSGISVLFVSHNLSQLMRLCPRCIWLDMGRVRAMGDSSQIVPEYVKESEPELEVRDLSSAAAVRSAAQVYNEDILVVENIELSDGQGSGIQRFASGHDMVFRCEYVVRQPLRKVSVQWTLSSPSGDVLANHYSGLVRPMDLAPGRYLTECRFPSIPLRKGLFPVHFSVYDENGCLFFAPFMSEVAVQDSRGSGHLVSDASLLDLRPEWMTQRMGG